ncbi:SET domain protein [Cerioporus squamosus]|nr:SET domain protein [Cerioporus squamosus]
MSSKRPQSSTRRPPHWPAHLEYLDEPRYHSSVPTHIRELVSPALSRHASAQNYPRKAPVAIQLISDPSHPARGQYGLFATKKIPPRTLVIDYIGEVHCDDRPGSDYDLSLYRTPDHVSVGVDAQFCGNEARFINDYRGVKPKPNASFQERKTESGELRMSVWSGSEPVKKGEELLVSYGKSWWRARQIADEEDS